MDAISHSVRNPAGWKTARLGDVVRLTNGDAFKPSDWSVAGVPIIRIQNLNDARKPFNYWAGPADDKVKVERGDLLIAWSGTPGTSFGAHIWAGEPGILNQHIFRADVVSADVTPEWLKLAVNHELDVLIGKAHGAVGLRHVTKGIVEGLAIQLPPLDEQKRIAAILDRQMEAVTLSRTAMHAQLAAIQKLPKAVLKAAFESLDGPDLPCRPIARVATLLPSRSVATAGAVRVYAITTACLTEFGFDPRGLKLAPMLGEHVEDCIAKAGEVLIARSNTPELVGRASVYCGDPPQCVATDLTIRIACGDEMSPQFLGAYLSHVYLSGHWLKEAGGASGSMKKITRTQVMALNVPTPPREIQDALSDRVAKQLSAVKKLRDVIRERLSKLQITEASIHHAAFRGEL